MPRCESGRISPGMLEKFVRKHLVRGRETFGHTAVLSRCTRSSGAADTHTQMPMPIPWVGFGFGFGVGSGVGTDAGTTTSVRCMHRRL
jgi:hypothetical protein